MSRILGLSLSLEVPLLVAREPTLPIMKGA